MLSIDEQVKVLNDFFNYFKIKDADKNPSLRIGHPETTKQGCLHIDTYSVNINKYWYALSIGCLEKLNREKKYCEIYLKIKEKLIFSSVINNATRFNNRNHQLELVQNNEYIYLDNFSHLSNDKCAGFYVYADFVIKIDNKDVLFYKLIPAAKSELDAIETDYNNYSYRKIFEAIKPLVINRDSIKDFKPLDNKELDSIVSKL